MNSKTDSGFGNNYGKLVGRIVRGPIKTHTTFDEDFYEIMLEVKRLSETVDVLPVTIGKRIISDLGKLDEGKEIAIKGEYRSTNKLVGDKSKLVLYFFAKDIIYDVDEVASECDDMNCLKLVGYICKMPVVRETPFHRQICDILVAVNRNAGSRSDYIPCIAWGRNAKYMGSLDVGTKVEIEGRIQSRPYKKTNESGQQEERVAYEVSCKNAHVVEQDLEEERVLPTFNGVAIQSV